MKMFRLLTGRTLLHGAVGSLLIKILSLFLALAVSVLLASTLGADKFGVYVLVFSSVMLLSIPLTLGLPILIVRYIPEYEFENNYSAIKGLLSRANQFVLITFSGFLAVALPLYLVFEGVFSIQVWETIFWGGGLLLFVGLNAVRCAALEGFRYVLLGQFPDLVLRNVFIILSFLVLSGLADVDAANTMMIHFFSSIATYITGLIFFKYLVGARVKGVKPEYHEKKWISQGALFSINSGVNNIKTKISMYILGALQGPGAVGVFEVAMKAASFVSFSLTAINKALAPHIVKAQQVKDEERLQRILKKSSLFMFLAALPLVILFTVWGDAIISVFYGEEYLMAYWPLVIICLGQLVNSYAGSVGLFLIMSNRQGFVLKVNLVNVILNSIAAFFLVDIYSISGAAVAYAILLVAQNVMLVMYSSRYLGVKTTAF